MALPLLQKNVQRVELIMCTRDSEDENTFTLELVTDSTSEENPNCYGSCKIEDNIEEDIKNEIVDGHEQLSQNLNFYDHLTSQDQESLKSVANVTELSDSNIKDINDSLSCQREANAEGVDLLLDSDSEYNSKTHISNNLDDHSVIEENLLSNIIITNVETVVEESDNSFNDNNVISNLELKGTKEGIKFECSHCQYLAKTRFALTRHLASHTVVRDAAISNQVCVGNQKLVSNEENRTSESENNFKNEVDIKFKCKFCLFQSKTRFALKRHCLSHKITISKTYSLKCNICSFVAKSNRGLGIHKASHILSCNFCSFVAKSKRGLDIHKASHIQSCNVCSFVAKSKRGLDVHNAAHTRAKKKYNNSHLKPIHDDYKSTKTNLKSHVNLTHSEVEFQCQYCSYMCSTKMGVDKHLIQHTKYNRPISKCRFCDFWSTKRALVKHATKHKQPLIQRNQGIFNCSYCSYSAKFQPNLTAHLLLHTKFNRPIFQCKLCPFKTTRAGLTRHINNIHGKKLFQGENYKKTEYDIQNISETKKTNVTGNKLSSKFEPGSVLYKMHNESSENSNNNNVSSRFSNGTRENITKNTKYKCDSCNFKTDLKDNLNDHKIVHVNINEVKFYKKTIKVKVDKCSKRFSGKENKKCEICSFSTFSRSLLTKHYLQNHADELTLRSKDIKPNTSVLDKNDLSLNPKLIDVFNKVNANKPKLIGNIHKKEKINSLFSCDLCSFMCDVRNKLKEHYQKKHTANAVLNEFSTSQKLKSKSSNINTLFKCKLCFYKTKFKQLLQRHIKMCHIPY